MTPQAGGRTRPGVRRGEIPGNWLANPVDQTLGDTAKNGAQLGFGAETSERGCAGQGVGAFVARGGAGGFSKTATIRIIIMAVLRCSPDRSFQRHEQSYCFRRELSDSIGRL
mgnify:CR=1 FL=1